MLLVVYQGYLVRKAPQDRKSEMAEAGNDMSKNRHKDWRISSCSGALLALYFIPTWTIAAFRLMVSPIHGFYERPSVAVAFFLSDVLQLTGEATIRAAWLLALGRLTVVAFFAIFLVFLTRRSIRKSGGSDEALGMALAIGSLISFASMAMASRVGEVAAMRLHATELLLLLGTAIVLQVERQIESQGERQVERQVERGTEHAGGPRPEQSAASDASALEQPQLLNHG